MIDSYDLNIFIDPIQLIMYIFWVTIVIDYDLISSLIYISKNSAKMNKIPLILYKIKKRVPIN